MKFSLVIGTLNRDKELEKCLDSIFAQKFKNWEIIIIDQSSDDKTEILISKYEQPNTKYFHVNFKGLSSARNYGFEYSIGDYICLMDDDAVYDEDFLYNAEKILSKRDKCILSGIIMSIEDHKTEFVDYSKLQEEEVLNCSKLLNSCPSAALIIPRKVFSDAGLFDERLGVGNAFAAGEETDFLLRSMDNDYQIVHSQTIKVFHPIKPIDYSNLAPLYQHYMGKGALVKKDIKFHKFYRLVPFAFRNIVGSIVKMISINNNQRIVYGIRLKGFIDGYRKFKP